MDLSHLDIFCAVARHGSVTRAAQELRRAQSNVTTRIRLLEQELGVELFLRAGKSMVLTPAGETLLAYAQRLLALAAEARQALRPGEPRGPLRLGAMDSTAASRLPGPLAAFHQRWPEVELSLEIGSSGHLLDDVAASRLDAALVAILPALDRWRAGLPLPVASELPEPFRTSLRGEEIYREQMMLALPEAHPDVARPGDIRVSAMAAFDARCSYRHLLEHWLTQGPEALARPPRVLELRSYHAILASIAAGGSIGIIPASLLARQAPAPVRTHCLGEVATWLVQRRDYHSAAFDVLRGQLRADAEAQAKTKAKTGAASAAAAPSTGRRAGRPACAPTGGSAA